MKKLASSDIQKLLASGFTALKQASDQTDPAIQAQIKKAASTIATAVKALEKNAQEAGATDNTKIILSTSYGKNLYQFIMGKVNELGLAGTPIIRIIGDVLVAGSINEKVSRVNLELNVKGDPAKVNAFEQFVTQNISNLRQTVALAVSSILTTKYNKQFNFSTELVGVSVNGKSLAVAEDLGSRMRREVGEADQLKSVAPGGAPSAPEQQPNDLDRDYDAELDAIRKQTLEKKQSSVSSIADRFAKLIK